MILFSSQLQKAGRALRIWMTLFYLLLFLWFDRRKWTYITGFSKNKRERRQINRARWLTKELVHLGSAFIKLGQLLSARGGGHEAN